jgi:S-adenosylmethionine:tRNA ribosyltransferase-isomerase
MHAEYYSLRQKAANTINNCVDEQKRVIAVGTTVTRTLETCAAAEGGVEPGSGWTELFIRPGYNYNIVEALITNFHLPKSTLLMLVAAFAGYEFMCTAYSTAIEEGYRFYSLGDAMLIL